MKIIILVLVILFFPVKSISQIERLSDNEISTFSKMVYDINIEAYNKHFSSQEEYWSYVQNSDKTLKKYDKSDSRLKRKVRERLSSYMLKYDIIERNYPKDKNKGLDSIFEFVKFRLWGNDKIKNKFFACDDFNAYVSVNGAFYLGRKLAEILTPEEIVFVMAHEYVHFLMKHIEVGMYANAKTKRRNDIVGGISEAALSAGYIYAASQVRASNNSDFADNYMEINRGIQNMVDGYTDIYGYRYSREQEYEADYFAFCFMKSFGEMDSAISAFEKIYVIEGADDDNTDDYSDHPSLLDRIKFLYFLKDWDGEIVDSNEDDLYYVP